MFDQPQTEITQAQVDALRWWHSIDLGNGIASKGDKTAEILHAEAEAIFQYGVTGKTVLDIGAWDGFFSFEAERRGAARVLATDHISWSGWGWGTKCGFDLAKAALQSRVEEREIDVPDLTPETVGHWDIVLFLGVLYHLQDPYAILKQISSIATDMIIVETATSLNHLAEPVARFWRGASLNDDSTNFWTPNMICLEAMMREAGFSRVTITEAPPLSKPPAIGSHPLVGRHIAFGWR